MENELKELIFEGTKLQYKRESINSEFGYEFVTDFYIGEEQVTSRKYIIFGERITKTQPKFAFRLWMDVEDSSWTKKQVRDKITHQMELLNRKDEIARGEII